MDEFADGRELTEQSSKLGLLLAIQSVLRAEVRDAPDLRRYDRLGSIRINVLHCSPPAKEATEVQISFQ